MYPNTLAAYELIQGISKGFKLCKKGLKIATIYHHLKSLNCFDHGTIKLIIRENQRDIILMFIVE